MNQQSLLQCAEFRRLCNSPVSCRCSFISCDGISEEKTVSSPEFGVLETYLGERICDWALASTRYIFVAFLAYPRKVIFYRDWDELCADISIAMLQIVVQIIAIFILRVNWILGPLFKTIILFSISWKCEQLSFFLAKSAVFIWRKSEFQF